MADDEKPEETEEVEAVEEETPAEPDTTEETEVQTEEPSSEEGTEETTEEETPEETEEAKFEKRFPRFKGETPEEYIKNLEDGYENSSTEAVRLARENKELREANLAQIANEDEDKPAPPEPPNLTLAWAEQQREQQWRNDWTDFTKLHPEIEQDESLFADFDKKTGDMFAFIQQTESRIPTLKEAMQKAWNYMNPDEISKEEQIALKTKDAGAGTKTKGVAKDAAKPLFTEKQIATARKFDPSLRDKSDAEIEKELAKYKA